MRPNILNINKYHIKYLLLIIILLYAADFSHAADTKSATDETSAILKVESKEAAAVKAAANAAVGEAQIIEGNTAVARDKAIDAAMRVAVEQAVSRYLSYVTIDENFQSLSEKVYSKANSYISNFNLLNESVTDDVYTVTIDTKISENKIKDILIKLKILTVNKDLPKFIIFIAEKGIDNSKYRFFWSSDEGSFIESTTAGDEIRKRFTEKGFTVVDKSEVMSKIKRGSLADKVALKDSDVIGLTKHTSAEIIIIGKALSQVMGNIQGSSMKSILGNVSARVIDNSGMLIASDSASAKVLHVEEGIGGDEALKKAAVVLADRFITAIMAKWGVDERESATINLNVSGLTYKRLQDFIRILKNDIRGVSNIVQRSFTSGGKANIIVDIKGEAAYVAKELKRRDFQTIDIQVTSFDAESINLILKQKESYDELPSLQTDGG